jgi:hypothetical protein
VNIQGNTHQKEQCWMYHNTLLQTLVQSNSNKNSWHKNRDENQWNRVEDADMNPHSYAHLVFDKVVKIHMMEKRQPLLQMLLGKVAICLQKTETISMPITLY